MTVEEACGEIPGLLCRWTLERTGSELTAQAVDLVVARTGRVLLIVLVAVLLHRLGSSAIRTFTVRYEEEINRRLARRRELGVTGTRGRAETRRLQRLHAIAQAGRSGLAILLGITALLLSLAQFVDLGPLLAGAGLTGLVVGFGAQHLIADLLAGFSMIAEDQYGVGDWIDVDGKIGEVERVGLRTTSFRDIDGVVWHLPNGRIGKVGNLTQRWARATIDVPLALDADIAHARRVVHEVASELAEDPDWAPDIIADPEIWGVTEWGPDGVELRVVIPTRPLKNWDVTRQLRERLKARFEAEGIRMPVRQLEVGGQVTTGAPVWVVHEAGPPPDVEQPAAHGPEDPASTGRVATEYGRVEPRQEPSER